ncbi:MAG TPA: hypothetical protein VLD60_08615 [Nitrospira sp.]|nr:hypothetical protein [Nitrospira sp.]
MSGVYWGIVGGFLAMVATLFVCFDLLYPKAKGSPTARSGRIDEPSEAGTQALDGRRRAAA